MTQVINLLDKTLSTVIDLPITKQNTFLVKRLTNLKERLKKNEFQLVVLGQFKRGKTTLINALLGKNVLPTAIVPLTSIITILKYGEKVNLTVVFLDGRKEEITFSKLSDYITEVKNPKNVKHVEQVIIDYPSSYLKNGIQIIDTPGVGSVYKHNTDVAYEFVPKADAGIFVLTADPPISETEIKFLVSIKDYLGKIIFIQNKIDQISENDRQESLDFTKKVIKEAVGNKELFFYQISAKLGLEGKIEKNSLKLKESKLPEFENELNKFFIGQKNQILQISIASKLLFLIREISLALQIEKKAILMPLATLKEKIDFFNRELANIKQEKEDADFIIQGQLEKLVNQVLLDDIESLKREQLPLILSEYEQFYQSHQNKSGQELAKALDKFLEKSIKKIFTNWRREEEDKLQKLLQSILSRFSSQANEFIKKAVELSANLFDLKIKEFETETKLAEKYEFKFSFEEYEVDIDFYTPIISRLPKFLSHKLLYKNMREKVIQVFDQHCGRSRYDFHQRILKSILDFRRNLDEVLDETVEGIQTAMQKGLSQKKKAVTAEEEITKSLQEQEVILSQVESNLVRIIR